MKAFYFVLLLSLALVTDLFSQNLVDQINTEEYCIVLDTMPKFSDTSDKIIGQELRDYIKQNLKYPSKIDCEGKVFVEFIVEKNGEITNVKTVKGLDEMGCIGFDEEAERLITNMPSWIPGILNGKAVRTKIILPIEFQI